MSFLADALDLAARGFLVFPLQPRDKVPFPRAHNCPEPHGQGCHDATRDPDTIRRWWEEHPDANIGLATGAASGIWALDLETPEEQDALEAHLGLRLPPTLTVATGRGLHLYYRPPEEGPAIGNRAKLKLGDKKHAIDVRGEGGYVVAPPSIHPSGKPYLFDPEEPQAPVAAPPELLRLVTQQPASAPAQKPRAGTPAFDRARKYLAAMPAAISGSGGHDTTFDAACALVLGFDLDEDTAFSLLSSDFNPRCQPPWSERELRHKVVDAKKRPGERGYLLNSPPPGDAPPQVKEGEGPAPKAWGPPIPFARYELPPFPTAALPPWLRLMVEATAIATQTPPDMAAMLSLAALATACAKRFNVEPRPGYREPVNLFVAVSMEPGNRKSAVFSQLQGPIEEYERELTEQRRAEVAEAQTALRILEKALEKAEGAAAKAKASELNARLEEAQEIARELAGRKRPVLPRLIADDATPERLASILSEQGGRLAVLSPEGGIFDAIAGRYTSGAPNLDVFLKGHAGESMRVDRVGRAAEHIPAPALTIGICIQPDILRGLLEKPGLRGRGLLGRFFYSLPKSLMGRRITAPPPIPEEVTRTYRARLRTLLALPARPDGAPEIVRYSAEADQRLRDFQDWMEPQLGADGELAPIQDWASKLVGAVARISGPLHAAEHAGELYPWSEEVAPETVARAIEIGHYLLAHARVAFAEMAADPRIEAAKKVGRWVSAQGSETFVKRDLYQALKGSFPTVADLDLPLALLEQHDLIRLRPVLDKPGPGRKPSPTYDVNPGVLAAGFWG
jgi:replicative DNA helicase